MMTQRVIGWTLLLLLRTILAVCSKFQCISNVTFFLISFLLIFFLFELHRLENTTKKILLFTTFSTEVNGASIDAVIAGLKQLDIELIVVYVNNIVSYIQSAMLFEQCVILYLSLLQTEQRTW